MAGPNKDVWTRRALSEVEVLLSNPDFVRDFEAIDTSRRTWTKQLSRLIDANNAAEPSLYLLIALKLTGKVPQQVPMASPIEIWSPKHRIYGTSTSHTQQAAYEIFQDALPHSDRVYLELDPNTTRSDVEYFLQRHWAKDVDPLLHDLQPRRRVRKSSTVIRDAEIRAKRANGASYTELVKEYGLSKRRIEQITNQKL